MGIGDCDAVAGPLEELDVVLPVPEGDRLLGGEAESPGEEREPRGLGDALGSKTVIQSSPQRMSCEISAEVCSAYIRALTTR